MQLETELTTYDSHSNNSSPKQQNNQQEPNKSENCSQKIKTILMIIFYISSFFSFQGKTIFFIILYLFFILNSRYERLDLITSILAFLISMLNIFFEYNFLPISQIIMSFSMFTFEYSRRMKREIILVWSEIKNLLVTMFFVICICAYSATAYYDDDSDVEVYYGTFGRSILTFIQALSLDDWGQIGRETEDLFGYLILCIYILIMTYFYLNIMMGILIETLQFDKKGKQLQDPFNYEITQHEIFEQFDKTQTLFDKCIIGQYYQWFVFIFSFGAITISILEHFDHTGTLVEFITEIIDDAIYTIHFIILIFMKGPIYELEKKNIVIMTLHFLAGPVSFICSFFYLEIGCLLNLLKIATTPSVKGIFIGTIDIFPILIPQFTELFGILMFISGIVTYNYSSFLGLKQQEYFSSFWGSFYTLVQIMTLDDWGNIVEPMYQQFNYIFPYFLIPIYIFLSNFIILNTLIALSCEYFVEVKYFKIENDMNLDRTSLFLQLNDFQHYCKQNQIQFSIPKVNIYCDDALCQKIKSDAIIKIQYGNQLFTVQAQYQSDAL